MLLLFIDGGGGSWEEGMSTEATGMFFRALRNLAEKLDFTYTRTYVCICIPCFLE